MTFASNGERGEPCGIPATLVCLIPSAMTPASRQRRSRRSIGLVFAGSATEHREELVRFATETLGLSRVTVEGAEADMFLLPDGSLFAVSDPRGMGDTSRSIGFLVADLDEAIADLRRAG